MKKIIFLVLLPFVITGCSIGNLSNKKIEAPITTSTPATSTPEVRRNPNKFSIADLKTGDKVGNFVFNSASGNLCESECYTDICGQISFDGEYMLDGSFIFNPKSPQPISFVTTSKTPGLVYDKENKSAKLLLADKNTIFLSNFNLDNSDFSIITSILPEFAQFVEKNKTSSSSVVYGQDVKVKIKNFKSELCVTDKNKVNSAELVNADSVQVVNKKECSVSSLDFKYPAVWGECNTEATGSAVIRTDYGKYKVDLVVEAKKATKAEYTKAKKDAFNITKLNGGEFFLEKKSGLMIGMLLLDGNYYNFNFHVNSNQIAPVGVKEGWIPENNIGRDVLLDIILSLKTVK